MRVLMDQESYDELLTRHDHPSDCYVRPGEYLHHMYRARSNISWRLRSLRHSPRRPSDMIARRSRTYACIKSGCASL